MNEQPFLIIETGLPAMPLRRHGGFDHWIRVAAGLDRHESVTFHSPGEDPLPEHAGWAGVLVTGSAAMVTDREAWSERSAAWLREAHARELPVFGICYGHQLIADAFGGKVDYHPKGREMGTVDIDQLPAAADDPLFAGLPQRFAAQTTHLQSVLQPPSEAVVLAANAHDGCNALRIGRSTWGVQFHPEFSATHMRGYLHARAEVLRKEGRDVLAMEHAIRPTPHARRLLSRFVRWARQRA